MNSQNIKELLKESSHVPELVPACTSCVWGKGEEEEQKAMGGKKTGWA